VRVSAQSERPASDLLTYLRMLAGDSQPSQFFDMRYSARQGVMRQRFVSVRRVHQTARRITDLSSHADVYVGVALRDRAHGDKYAITGSHLLYIECDDPAARERLEDFAYSPSMIVASGSPGHLHIYWRLRERASSAQVESINRRLAVALHGEPRCADIVRLLRPPTSLNHKHTPPVAVKLLEHNAHVRYALTELADSLPEDPQPSRISVARAVRRRVGRTTFDRELLALPAAEYVRVLANLEPNRAGKILCPFHHETDPSLQLYADGTFYCFGARCHKGGTIFDFAAALWGTGTRDQDFLELRQRLARLFGLMSLTQQGSSTGTPVQTASSLPARSPRQVLLAPFLLAVVLLAGCAPPQIQSQPSSIHPPAEDRCVEHDGLPDRRCTPGAIRSGLSLATICAFGYSRSVRPPESFTEPLKLRQMRAYSLPGSPRAYEEDHLVPLSIGGAPRDPRNLWPEPRSGPNNAEQKDQLETWAARMGCTGRIPLARLQRETASDWPALYRAAGGERVLRNYPPGG
jgi:hypothetical protein